MRLYRQSSSLFLYVLAAVVILAAVALSLVRLAIPYADDFRQQIELAVSDAVGRDVRISEIDASWRHFKPQIELSNVSISLTDEQKVEFGHMALGVDLIGSVVSQRLVTNEIRLAGFELYVLEDLGGRFSLMGLTPSEKASQGGQYRQFARWLAEQKQIIVENGTIYVTSEKRPELLQIFSRLGIYMVNSDDQQQISVNVDLPSELGGSIELVSNFNGMPLLEDDWSISSYLRGGDISVAGLASEFFVEAAGLEKIRGGEIEFELWADIDSDQNLEGQGYLNAANLRLSGGKADNLASELIIREANADFALSKDGQKWALAFEPLRVARTGAAEQSFDLQLLYNDAVEHRSLTLQSGAFRPKELVDLFKDSSFLSAQQLAEMRKFSFNTNIQHAVLHWQPKNKPVISAYAEFDDFALQKSKSLPGVSGLQGNISYQDGRGQLVLSATDAILDAEQWFREPLRFDRISADVSWLMSEDQSIINVDDISIGNSDLSVSGALSAHLPGDDSKSPYLDAQLNLAHVDIAKRSLYLPAKVMPEKSLKWYDRALKGGQLSQGKIALQGELAAFPFKNGGGHFTVDAHISNGDLEYTKGWPALQQIDADLQIRNAAIEIVASSGKMFSTTISEAKISVADFSVQPALMTVTGQASGPSADTLLFLEQSPLKERFKDSLDVLAVGGDSSLSLQLDIPIPGPTTVSGQLALIDNRLSVANDEFVASHVNGVLGFDNKGLHGKDVAAIVFDMPVTVDIEPILEEGKPGTKFVGYGEGAVATYAKLSGLPWLEKRAEGSSAWKAEVVIVGGKPDLYLESDMVGISSRFPFPFAKDAEQAQVFSLATTLPFGSELVELSYGSEVLAHLIINSDANKNRLSVLNVGLKSKPASLVAGTAGVFINGEMDSLAIEDWFAISEMLSEEDQAAESLPMEINLELAELDVFGYKWKNIVSQSSLVNGLWNVSVDGEGLRGRLQTSGRDSDTHISVRMDELTLASASESELDAETQADELDPREMPTFEVRVDQLHYDQLELGQFAFKTNRTKQGQHIDDIAIRSANFLMAGAGNWTRVANDQRSSFNVTIESGDLSKMLQQLDYASDNISGGKASLDANVFWQGAPTAYAHEKLNGQLGLSINDINFSDIDPGAGRVFGLLSIQALPQRLSLDFSDFFKKGLQIKTVNGSFSVKNGDAVTDDLVMQGTAARIDVAGRIGLAQQDYDQVLAVTPEVGSSLPLVGAAVAGPAGAGVGTAIMFLHKLFNPKILHYKYQITGPWQEPSVVLLKSDNSGKADDESAISDDEG